MILLYNQLVSSTSQTDLEPSVGPGRVAFADGTELLPPSSRRSPFVRTWTRRVLSLSLYTALFALVWLFLPVLVLVGWVVDRARGKPVIVRASLFFAVYLALELTGVALSLAMWIGGRTWMGAPRHQLLRWSFALQCWWLRNLFGAGQRLFHWRVQVTGEDAIERGKMLFFIRHVSTADTALAGVFVSDRHGIALRYVLKSELLWDPCLDIVGNRLPNGFVVRGRGQTEQAVAEVVRLTEHLGPSDGVLIYPEGTRFTRAKQARILAKIESKAESRDELERARALRHVLPPRLAGPLALLEHADTADVVFCAHTGFERALGFQQFMAGALNDLRVNITFWRVPRADIPEEHDARVAWLYEQWSRMDAWIGAQTEPEPS